MSIFVIKLIACITMVLDHIKYALPETKNFVTIYFGRMAFPFFAFLLAEGYSHTRDLKKYYKRLFLAAIISQIPFMLFRTLVGDWKLLNILFTLLLGLVSITIWDKFGRKYFISIPLCLGIIFLGQLLKVDYGWFGVASCLVLYVFRNQKIGRIFAYLLLTLIYYYPRFLMNCSIENLLKYSFTILPVFLLLFYNGKLGKKTKYLYYIFYPLHMMILFGIYYLTKIYA